MKKIMYKLWEINSIAVGVSAILVLCVSMLLNYDKTIFFFENNLFIRTGEIVWGTSALPYYVMKIKEVKNE